MTTFDADRRTVLKASGASLAAVLVAGCSGDGGDDDDGNDDEDGGAAEVEIDPGTQILLEGVTSGWEGAEPADIEGETNPTLVLQDGEDYEIGWVQGDGGTHNLELRDENEEVVDGYATDITNEPGDDGDFISFTATGEITHYRCNPHADMEGDIRVE